MESDVRNRIASLKQDAPKFVEKEATAGQMRSASPAKPLEMASENQTSRAEKRIDVPILKANVVRERKVGGVRKDNPANRVSVPLVNLDNDGPRTAIVDRKAKDSDADRCLDSLGCSTATKMGASARMNLIACEKCLANSTATKMDSLILPNCSARRRDRPTAAAPMEIVLPMVDDLTDNRLAMAIVDPMHADLMATAHAKVLRVPKGIVLATETAGPRLIVRATVNVVRKPIVRATGNESPSHVRKVVPLVAMAKETSRATTNHATRRRSVSVGQFERPQRV
jgi:hypothetical protein